MPAWLAVAFAAAAVAWILLLAAAPLLPVPAAGVLYGAGSLLCHQIAERSFSLGGFQLPVCGRCFGLYAGGAMGACAGAFVVGTGRAARTLDRAALSAITAAAAIPTALTVLLERGAGWELSNVARAAAAVPLAAVVACVVVRARPTLHYDECASRRPIGPGQPPGTLI